MFKPNSNDNANSDEEVFRKPDFPRYSESFLQSVFKQKMQWAKLYEIATIKIHISY